MRDAGGELAERGQPVALHQLLARHRELGAALLDLGLEPLSEVAELRHGHAQALPHEIEGAGELRELRAAADLDRVIELHLADRGRRFDQPGDGRADEEPREHDDQHREQRHLDGDDENRTLPDVGKLGIDLVEVERESSTPRTLRSAGCAWHEASLHAGSL